MYSFDIGNRSIRIGNIRMEDLTLALQWYNRVEDFRFATGIDSSVSINHLKLSFAEASSSENDFFLGVYLKDENKIIGIIRGSFKYKSKSIVWINSLIIDTLYQCRGFGRMAVELLLDDIKENGIIKTVFISVSKNNLRGISFWKKRGFAELDGIVNLLKTSDIRQDVIIMNKQL